MRYSAYAGAVEEHPCAAVSDGYLQLGRCPRHIGLSGLHAVETQGYDRRLGVAIFRLAVHVCDSYCGRTPACRATVGADSIERYAVHAYRVGEWRDDLQRPPSPLDRGGGRVDLVVADRDEVVPVLAVRLVGRGCDLVAGRAEDGQVDICFERCVCCLPVGGSDGAAHGHGP